jgi:hypothetical protein
MKVQKVIFLGERLSQDLMQLVPTVKAMAAYSSEKKSAMLSEQVAKSLQITDQKKVCYSESDNKNSMNDCMPIDTFMNNDDKHAESGNNDTDFVQKDV